MKKKKDDNIDALIKPYLPLDSRRKIDDLIRYIQIQQIPMSPKLDKMICSKIADDDLRFYYDCISPVKAHNRSFNSLKKKKKRSFFGGITNTVTKVKKKGKRIINSIKKNDSNQKITVNPNSSEYDSQMMKANLKSKYDGYDYGLSDW